MRGVSPTGRSAIPVLVLLIAALSFPDATAGTSGTKLSIVQLGDSVAAGEGTLYGYRYDTRTREWTGGNVDSTWPGPYPKCHDSPAAYGNVVARQLGATFSQFACTGATFDNGITTRQTESGFLSTTTLRPAQFGNWATGTDLNAAYDAAEPDVVLVTFGADDARFVKIVEACMLNAAANAVDLASLECTAVNPGPTITRDFIDYVGSGALANDYRLLAQWIAARGRAAKPAKVPKVVFTTYPNPIPPGGVRCPDTSVLSPQQLTYLRSIVEQASELILTTVRGIDSPQFTVADLSDVYTGHTWCTRKPWAYGLSIYSVTDPSSFESQAPFHPTPRGQRRIAALVTPVVRDLLDG
jgi:lysophospholipase L1-like esterase